MDQNCYNQKYRPTFDNMRFPSKLWVVVNSKTINSIKWGKSHNRCVIIIDRDGLEKYLNSTMSMFDAKSVTSFIEELKRHNFKKLPDDYEGQNEVKYYHSFFIKDRFNLLANVIRDEPTCSYTRMQFSTSTKLNDVLFKSYLHCKKVTEELANTLAQDAETIEISSEHYLDPSESTSSFKKTSEYVGFYGLGASPEKVKEFFGEFLPKCTKAQDHAPGSTTTASSSSLAQPTTASSSSLVQPTTASSSSLVQPTTASSSSLVQPTTFPSSSEKMKFPALVDTPDNFLDPLKGKSGEYSALRDNSVGNMSHAKKQDFSMDVDMPNITPNTTNKN